MTASRQTNSQKFSGDRNSSPECQFTARRRSPPTESRNHLRAWKSPYEAAGRPVWCIAATHDTGFERDQRNNGVTHKIDPAIDGEREYVNDTLSSTGLVIQRDHLTPSDALTTAKTATGGEFHSDGRILILVLKDSASPAN